MSSGLSRAADRLGIARIAGLGRTVLLLGFVLSGCSPVPETGPVRPPLEGCGSRAEGSRWAVGAQRLASRAATPVLSAAAGVAVGARRVYALDPLRPGVLVVERDLAGGRWIGRHGSGPGELAATPAFVYGSRVRWIELSADTLLVYDGQRVHRFDARTGRFLGPDRFPAGRGSRVLRRLQASPRGVLFDAGDYDSPDHAMTVHRVGDERVAVLRVALPPPPQRAGGGISVGPDQALPLWAASGECVVASDGAGAFLIRASLRTGAVDTLPLRGSMWKRPVRSPPQRRFGGSPLPPPTLVARIRGLNVDPDGYAWLRPVALDAPPGGGIPVVIVSLASGIERLDTVPAFPAAFDEPGSYFGFLPAPDGGLQLVRVNTRSPVATGP